MNAAENNRVVEFRQFKQRIRGSTDELVVGLDIGKRKRHAFFGNGNGSLPTVRAIRKQRGRAPTG
jgi:hypothetical protein